MDEENINALEKELDQAHSKFIAIRDHINETISDDITSLEKMLVELRKAETDTQVDAPKDMDDAMSGEVEEQLMVDTQVDAPDNFDKAMSGEAEMQLNVEPAPALLNVRQLEVINEKLQMTSKKLQNLSTKHRDNHKVISKMGKIIDRYFVSDFTGTTPVDAFQHEQNNMIFNKVIAKHYLYQGMDDVARLLIQESQMPEDMAKEVVQPDNNFAEIYRIQKCIQQHDLGPAFVWAARYTNELLAINSALEFKLHRLVFLQILSHGIPAQVDGIEYARTYLVKFFYRFQQEILNLMGCFIYLPMGIKNSPYKDLMLPEMWTEVSHVFLKDACSILGISENTDLSVIVSAGCKALTNLVNIKEVMQSSNVLDSWSGRFEYPFNTEYQYHSIFACPILREQTSDENPPMKLVCGHVISHDALHRLSNGIVFKCPYCPVEQRPDDANRIYF